MKVLVTDASYSHTLAIVRYLGKQGIDVFTIGSNKYNISILSKYCRKGYIGPSILDEPAYLRFMIELVQKEHFDLLIPVSYRATKIVAQNREQIENLTCLVVADSDKLAITSDKSKTYTLAEQIGILFPKTYYLKNIDELGKIANQIDYPAVVKPIYEIGGGGSIYPLNRKELIVGYRQVCEKYGFKEDSLPMIQEYIAGDPYTYGCSALYQEGQCKRIFMHKEVRSIPVTGGSGSYLESIYDITLKNNSIKLLDSLGWHGVALVEFKKDKYGRYYLMEINGKIWASTEVALKAGCNFPFYLCQIANGSQLKYSDDYNRKLRFQFMNREIAHCRHRISSLPKVIYDTVNPTVKSDYWLSDLRPNLIDSVNTLLALFHSTL
jgi:predicted ATP-grasp superfamily ATP-dependent carboligase